MNLLFVMMLLAGNVDNISPELKSQLEQIDEKYDYSVEKKDLENPEFFGRYFPNQLEKPVKQVEEAFWPVMITNFLLPCGGLWAPFLFLEDPPEYTLTMFGDYFLPYIIANTLSYTAYVGSASIAGATGGLAAIVSLACVGVGIAGCVVANWQAPIASLNSWDRAYKRRAYEEKQYILKENEKNTISKHSYLDKNSDIEPVDENPEVKEMEDETVPY